jgi:hypothetical protein
MKRFSDWLLADQPQQDRLPCSDCGLLIYVSKGTSPDNLLCFECEKRQRQREHGANRVQEKARQDGSVATSEGKPCDDSVLLWIDDQVRGPYTIAAIADLVREGTIGPDTKAIQSSTFSRDKQWTNTWSSVRLLVPETTTRRPVLLPQGGESRIWFYCSDGVQHGPIQDQEFHALISGGRIGASTPIWTHPLTEWVEAGSVEGLIPPTLSPPPLARISSAIQHAGIGPIPADSVTKQRRHPIGSHDTEPSTRFVSALSGLSLVCLAVQWMAIYNGGEWGQQIILETVRDGHLVRAIGVWMGMSTAAILATASALPIRRHPFGASLVVASVVTILIVLLVA